MAVAVLGSLAIPNSHCGLCGRKATLPLNCSQGIFVVRSASRMTDIESETQDRVGYNAHDKIPIRVELEHTHTHTHTYISPSVVISDLTHTHVEFSLGVNLCTHTSEGIQNSRLLYYLITEIKTWLNINHITVHKKTFCIF